MVEMERILCPVDFSEASRHALDHGLAIAGWYGARLTALHVVDPVTAAAPGTLIGPYPFRPVPDVMALERTRETLREFLRAAGASGDVDACVQPGRIADVIVERARAWPVDLIAIGTHGLGGFDHLVLGSVAEKVVRKAACPVLTVPPRARATSRLPFRRLLCPVDFSEPSIAALGMAFSLAQESAAALTVLHVIEPWASGDASARDPLFASYYQERECELLRRLESLVSSSVRDWCEPTTRLGRGKGAQEILRVADDESADLIVMGVHGRNVLDLMVFGSVTNQVVRAATCPVMTVRV